MKAVHPERAEQKRNRSSLQARRTLRRRRAACPNRVVRLAERRQRLVSSLEAGRSETII